MAEQGLRRPTAISLYVELKRGGDVIMIHQDRSFPDLSSHNSPPNRTK
jgi:hypothetical protein